MSSSTAGGGPRPVCFMVMPFRRRKVEGTVTAGTPGELDCDALWDRVYRPVIEKLGYLPIRADTDGGGSGRVASGRDPKAGGDLGRDG
jgi:hypothetical protein